MIRFARAPVRIDFAGGWTDVDAFCDREPGVVVNAAISLHVQAEARLGGGKFRLFAEDIGERVWFDSPSEIRYDGTLDLHKAALNMLPVAGGIELISTSDVPVGSGLGASGALDVALLHVLTQCRDEPRATIDLAEMGVHLETQELGLAGGRQDQYAAALGGFHTLRFGGGAVGVDRIAVSNEAATELEAHLTLLYTGKSHFSSDTHERVWRAHADGAPEVVDALRSMRDVAAETGVAIAEGRWDTLARLINENWTQQQRLDPTIASPGMATIEAAVREAGAWGLKATGAGAGGCAVVLAAPERRDRIIQAAAASGATVLPAMFTEDGVTGWEAEDHAGGG